MLKKEKNYDKWCKEMRQVEKARQQEVSASLAVFNKRKNLIHDRKHEEELAAVTAYQKEQNDLKARRRAAEARAKSISELSRKQVLESHSQRQSNHGAMLSCGGVKFISTQKDYADAVEDLEKVVEKLKAHNARQE